VAPDADRYPTAYSIGDLMVERALNKDMHVYSTFSDGQNTVEENVAEAERLGLKEIVFADHVRSDSKWIPDYVAAVKECGEHTAIVLHCAVEAKILDIYGRLDLPRKLIGVEAVYVVSHQAPSPDGPMNPRSTRERIEVGELDPQVVLRWMVAGTAAALLRHEDVVIGHLFSALPMLGLGEGDVPPELVDSLVIAAVESNARILVDEDRRCPAPGTLWPFLRHGVPVLLGTGSRNRETIGCYDYCAGILHGMHEPDLARAG
jgi:histidinol phosphatase-like PHP family hydrolase